MIEQIYKTTIQLGAENDRKTLLGLSNHQEMGANAQLVYIYALPNSEPAIPYPLGPGRTVYIGETKRKTGAGKRFGGHISKSLTEGLSTLINHTLSVYYHHGTPLHLCVFRINDGRSTSDAERVLLRSHLHKYGAYPIAQGASGRDNTPCEVRRMYESEKALHDKCIKLFDTNAL